MLRDIIALGRRTGAAEVDDQLVADVPETLILRVGKCRPTPICYDCVLRGGDQGRRAMQTSSKRDHSLEPTLAAIGFVCRKASIILWIGIPPALLSLIVTYAIHREWIPGALFEINAPSRLPPSMAWVETIVDGICLTLFAVGVHRLVLRQELVAGIPLRLRRYELAYAGTLILFAAAETLIVLIVGGIVSALGEPVPAQWMVVLTAAAPVIIIVGIWVHIRLALIFPHAALTGRIDPRPSWRAMRGNVYRFFAGAVVLGLFCAAVQIPILLALTELDRYWTNAAWVMFAGPVIIVMLRGLAVAMIIAFVSYTYQALVLLADQTDADGLEYMSGQPPESAAL